MPGYSEIQALWILQEIRQPDDKDAVVSVVGRHIIIGDHHLSE